MLVSKRYGTGIDLGGCFLSARMVDEVRMCSPVSLAFGGYCLL